MQPVNKDATEVWQIDPKSDREETSNYLSWFCNEYVCFLEHIHEMQGKVETYIFDQFELDRRAAKDSPVLEESDPSDNQNVLSVSSWATGDGHGWRWDQARCVASYSTCMCHWVYWRYQVATNKPYPGIWTLNKVTTHIGRFLRSRSPRAPKYTIRFNRFSRQAVWNIALEEELLLHLVNEHKFMN